MQVLKKTKKNWYILPGFVNLNHNIWVTSHLFYLLAQSNPSNYKLFSRTRCVQVTNQAGKYTHVSNIRINHLCCKTYFYFLVHLYLISLLIFAHVGTKYFTDLV